MKIYTRSGDAGSTGLIGGTRVPKDHVRIEAYGTVDELNAFLGLARSHDVGEEIDRLLATIQHSLFSVGAELATEKPQEANTRWIGESQVQMLEQSIDHFESQLPPLTQFILPAGHPATAALHVARAVCRRAERRVVSLAGTADVSEQLVIYLNRLGDLLFVLSRVVTQMAGLEEQPWKQPDR